MSTLCYPVSVVSVNVCMGVTVIRRVYVVRVAMPLSTIHPESICPHVHYVSITDAMLVLVNLTLDDKAKAQK